MIYRHDKGVCQYLEAATSVHKMLHAAVFQMSVLPLVAYGIVFPSKPLVGYWLDTRMGLVLDMPRGAVITLRPLSAAKGFRTSTDAAETFLHSRCQGKQA